MIEQRNASKIKYDHIINQLNEYMVTKQLPLYLQKKLRNFYELRYRKSFFNEKRILESLSGKFALNNNFSSHPLQKLYKEKFLRKFE